MIRIASLVGEAWPVALTELISLLRQGTVQGSKSTVMTPLAWGLAILTTGMLGGTRAGLPGWVVGILSGCFVLLVISFLVAYAYFAWTNPDALRTERYTLTKLAIEHHLRGDDLAGITEAISISEDELQGKKIALPTPDAKPRKSRAAKEDKTSEGHSL